MEPELAPPEMQLAAVLYLISSSALRGTSEAKTRALLGHLRLLAAEPALDPVLRETVAELLGIWESMPLRPVSAPAVAASGAALSSRLH